MEKEKSIELRSRVLETRRVNWKHFSYIQEKSFKNLSPEAKNKLRESILSNSFTQPFYVWQNPIDGVLYCLDGRHRTLILEELEDEGYKVPMLLDATFIHCNDIKEAAQLVLIYSSMYAKVTEAGLFDFIEMYELNQEQLSEVINLPDVNWDKFFGDQNMDFSIKNLELDPEMFGSEMTLKLTFSKDDYLLVRERLNNYKELHGLQTNESVILKLLSIEPNV